MSIKFDLPMNGTKVRNIEELRENFSTEILGFYDRGILHKWLKTRGLGIEADSVENIPANSDRIEILVRLCEIFNIDADRSMLEAALSVDEIVPENSSVEVIQPSAPQGNSMSTESADSGGERSGQGGSSESDMFQIIEGGSVEAKTALAASEDLPSYLQNKLLDEIDELVLVALAKNPSLSDEAQEVLANTGTPEIREALASNPSLNEKQQRYLAKTGNDATKYEAARNPSLAKDVQKLLLSESDYVRDGLASNPSIDEEIQKQLLDAGNIYNLVKNPALIARLQNEIAKSENESILHRLASNPSLTSALMQRFSDSDADHAIKVGLASNPSLPESFQATLMAEWDREILAALAVNPTLKVPQQAELITKGDVDVRLAVLDNPSLDERLRKRVCSSFTQADLDSAEEDESRKWTRYRERSDEASEAMKKHSDAVFGSSLFNSEAKIERLERESERACRRSDEADAEHSKAAKRTEKLRKILEAMPASAAAPAPVRPAATWPFPIP